MNDASDLREGNLSVPQSGEEAGAPGVLAPAVIAQFVASVDEGDRQQLLDAIAELHPADTADLLEHLPADAFRKAIHLLDKDLPPLAIAELSDETRLAALNEQTDAGIAAMIERLDSDDASFLLNDLAEDRRASVLARVSATDRAAIETSLAFDEESAGRLMQRGFVAAPVFWTVGQTLDHMRSVASDDLPETFFEIYIVDPAFRLQGSVPLSTLIRAVRDTPLKSIMKDVAVSIQREMHQEEVAYVFQQYNLASAPVVDEAGRLTGMITIDDIVDVIQEENREDILALSGVREAGAHQSVLSAVRARIPWLGMNLVTAFCASVVVAIFQGTIEQVVALAILMPVVAGLCGNAGSQALTVTVRAIAERELDGPLIGRAVRREALTALVNGVVIASAAAFVAAVWFQDVLIGAAIGGAMVFTFLFAGLIGILVPLAMKRFGVDPAVASPVLVLTSIDLIGFFVFLGLATLILL